MSYRTKAENAAHMREWRRKNPERSKELMRQSYQRCSKTEARRAARRNHHLLTHYGISLIEYEDKHKAQEGLCYICRLPEMGIRRGTCKSLDVDHNHETGQVRDLLCSACNTAFGLLKEDPQRIETLLLYAQKWQVENLKKIA